MSDPRDYKPYPLLPKGGSGTAPPVAERRILVEDNPLSPREFCLWLKGFFDIGDCWTAQANDKGLSVEQKTLIGRQLSKVILSEHKESK